MKKLKALLIKLNTKPSTDRALWCGSYQQELKTFFEFWCKKKLNVDVKISITFGSFENEDITVETLDEVANEYTKSHPYGFFIFISDTKLQGHIAEGLNGDKWVWVLHTQGADWAPLYNTTHRLSHELSHWLLRNMGKPKRIHYTRVHQNDMTLSKDTGVNDYWIPRRFAYSWFYYWCVFRDRFELVKKSKPGKTKYVTVGGDYE